MAKKTEVIYLQCEKCKQNNYSVRRAIRSGQDKPEKLELKKFCDTCRSHQLHKEVKAPKTKN